MQLQQVIDEVLVPLGHQKPFNFYTNNINASITVSEFFVAETIIELNNAMKAKPLSVNTVVNYLRTVRDAMAVPQVRAMLGNTSNMESTLWRLIEQADKASNDARRGGVPPVAPPTRQAIQEHDEENIPLDIETIENAIPETQTDYAEQTAVLQAQFQKEREEFTNTTALLEDSIRQLREDSTKYKAQCECLIAENTKLWDFMTSKFNLR